MFDELYVSTKSDVRCLDIFTGKTKRILANFVDAEETIVDL
jgi:hypothetical protein